VTRNRSFKKVIRARMRRTGESYTAARARLQRSAPPTRAVKQGGSGMYPFERFTERAKKVLTLAQEEAARAHHSYIGTEHLLLGLLREEEGVARIVLTALGVETERAREAIQAKLGSQPQVEIQQIIPTSRVKRVIEIAFETARQMGNPFVGTEHLLLALLIEGEGLAAHVLKDMGVTLDAARDQVKLALAAGPPEPAGPPEAVPGSQAGTRPALLHADAELQELMTRASDLARQRGAQLIGLDDVIEAIRITQAPPPPPEAGPPAV
jgi:ATP-dependent Clp protease ATP-binding subunit ClpA